jgi:hypothetical protein
MQAVINHISNIELKIKDLAGQVLSIELKLRLLAESNEPFREKVYSLIKIEKPKPSNRKNQYWNCDLKLLIKAFTSEFDHKLTSDEKLAIDDFNNVRNKLLHGDFIELMDALKIPVEGQEILPSGKRNKLEWRNKEYAVQNNVLRQAINRFDVNEIAEKVIERSVRISSVIDKCLRGE